MASISASVFLLFIITVLALHARFTDSIVFIDFCFINYIKHQVLQRKDGYLQ